MPRPAERWALPGTVEEYSWFTQFWDDERQLSTEVKRRILPDFEGDHVFILFDPDATWDSAGEHVVLWGRTVMEKKNELDALLLALDRMRTGGAET